MQSVLNVKIEPGDDRDIKSPWGIQNLVMQNVFNVLNAPDWPEFVQLSIDYN